MDELDQTTEQTEVKEKKTKKEKKPFNPKNCRISFTEAYGKLQSNVVVLALTCVAAFIVMALVAAAVFFANVKGPEKVLVPNVVGKELEQALMEMQVKELYPKINLRYSDVPGDEGTILDQSPEAGSIVKGYSRVSLVVSRGVIVDKVEDYVGMNYNDLQLKIQTLFAGQTRPLIVLSSPEYKPDAAEAGTILEQDPPAGTQISEPVKVHLIVSRGPNYDNTRVPNLIGQSVNDILQVIARTKLVFNITSHIAEEDEVPGTVVSQEEISDEYLANYTPLSFEMAMPAAALNDDIYGIFQVELAEYPYPVPMKLDAVPSEGEAYTIISFNHPGGNVTIPYAVPRDTTLVLSVVDKVAAKKTVN